MSKPKKKTKKQLFYDELCRILWQNKSLDELWNEYVDFMDTQTIYKPAKKYKTKFIYCDEWNLPLYKTPYIIIARKLISDYYKRTETAITFGAYWQELKNIINDFRNKWNDCCHSNRQYWHVNTFLIDYEKVFYKRFLELNPTIAELEGTLQAIIQLHKVGIKNEVLENRFKELTNHYDAKIIITIPAVEKAIENAWQNKQYQLLREGKLELTVNHLKDLEVVKDEK